MLIELWLLVECKVNQMLIDVIYCWQFHILIQYKCSSYSLNWNLSFYISHSLYLLVCIYSVVLYLSVVQIQNSIYILYVFVCFFYTSFWSFTIFSRFLYAKMLHSYILCHKVDISKVSNKIWLHGSRFCCLWYICQLTVFHFSWIFYCPIWRW